MEELLKNKLLHKFKKPINTAKDCDLLSKEIYLGTNRNISASTLRRFFGLLPSKSNVSKYNLDTLAIFCGEKDYQTFCNNSDRSSFDSLNNNSNQLYKLKELTEFTLNSISKKALGDFSKTLPRKGFNNELNKFLNSNYSIYPVIAPGGYGKSVALAHWVKSVDIDKNVVLFCSASIFYQLISLKNNLKNQMNLSIEKSSRYFNQVKDKTTIIVIDSIDELASNLKKIEEILNFISELLNHYYNSRRIKFIFSIRESFWNRMVKMEFNQRFNASNQKYLVFSIESGYNNFPKLSVSEIKQIIDLKNDYINKSFQYNAIPYLLQDLIRIPINLYFLLELLEKDNTIDTISSNSLNRKYLNEFVFNSKFAENKEDILWVLIELIEKENNGFSINKKLIKEIFPIHLKRETDFYNAYKELITNGIIFEERLENNYGIFSTQVGFKHLNFYYYLSALNQIHTFGELNYSLLGSICCSKRNNEWKSNLISVLYEIAYDNEDYETLKDFCLLPEEILSSLAVRFSVGNSFRIKNLIRNKLIQKYAACPAGQMYFFEQFVDTNFIMNNYEYRIKEYLKHKKTNESLLFGNSILFLSGFLKMDTAMCQHHFQLIKSIEPDADTHPWPIGRKVACHILYRYLVDKNPINSLWEFISKYQKIAYNFKGYLNLGLIEFELSILVSLVLVKEFELIIQLEQNIYNTYKINHPKDDFFKMLSINQNILPYLFSQFAKFKLGYEVDDDYIEILEETVDNFRSTYDDFQYKILLKYFLFEWYKYKDKEKSKELYTLALKLCEFAQYDFYNAFLHLHQPEDSINLIKKDEIQF